MGYALRRPDDDDDVKPVAEGLRVRFARRVERVMEAIMSFVHPRVPVSEIGRMGRLVKNWDGYGSGAVPRAAREHALHFLQRADEKFGVSIPPPTVGALGRGLVLVWRAPVRVGTRITGEREIEMIFHERGNEWSVSDRDGIEPTHSGENVDEGVLLIIIDRYVVA